MAYTPNPDDPTQPTGSVDASNAAPEFRALKQKIISLVTTLAQWNPSDKSGNITLSGGNLIATKNLSDGLSAGVRANIGKGSGKYYWEVTIIALTGPINLGVAKLTSTLAQQLGFDSGGFAYRQDATRFNNSVSAAYGATFAAGDVIGVAMDLDADQITFYKNNVSQGVIYAGSLIGTYYPAASIQNLNDQVSVNFGGTPFVYAIPTGFAALQLSSVIATSGSSFMYTQFFNAGMPVY